MSLEIFSKYLRKLLSLLGYSTHKLLSTQRVNYKFNNYNFKTAFVLTLVQMFSKLEQQIVLRNKVDFRTLNNIEYFILNTKRIITSSGHREDSVDLGTNQHVYK